MKDAEKGFEIVELKLCTSQLKYSRDELNKWEEIFSSSDYLFFSYLLQVVPKEGKSILERNCIYYRVIIKISKQTLTISRKELVSEIKMRVSIFNSSSSISYEIIFI